MKVTIPEREIEVCDRCNKEGFLDRCHVCGDTYCLTCEGTVAGSGGFTTLCRKCAERDDVKSICDEFARQLSVIYDRRQKKLQSLQQG